MASESRDEMLVERLVTYTIEIDGKVIVVEHVPARVNEETGERYFSPETVDRLQQIVRQGRSPTRVIKTPVFYFTARGTVLIALLLLQCGPTPYSHAPLFQ